MKFFFHDAEAGPKSVVSKSVAPKSVAREAAYGFSLSPLSPDDPDMAEGFLQSAFWAEFKAATGWKPQRFRIESPDSNYRCDLLVLERRLRAGFGFAYVPHGPERFPEHCAESADRDSFLEALAKALRPHCSSRCLFIRFDLPQYVKAEHRPGYLKRGTAVQPPDTVLLDLGPEEAEILAAMKPKWRYNIRLAEKKGVTVSEEGPESLQVFYSLYLATAERDRIAVHPYSYYSRLFSLPPSHDAKPGVWVARYEGEALAAIVTLFRRTRAVYLYGASSDEHRNLMPAYALQWEAIRAAKASGCTEYDFFGIPPDDDPAHPMAGLYRFKTGFGGRIAHREGCVDVPYLKLPYTLFSLAEKLRLFWFKRVKKASR
ncbi:MAG: peptidoglycan bridge formation glycyltransferase FemA/FemB family protein [Rectinemataceae bacterium]